MLKMPATASTVRNSIRIGSIWPAGSSKYITLTIER
jgi:hypothetical protein